MGDRTEVQGLEALLDEWACAGIGVRRSLERRLSARLDEMDPGSVPANVVARLEALRLSGRGFSRELPSNAVFVPFVDEAGGLVAAIQVHEGGLHEGALQSKMTPECRQACMGAIRLASKIAERRTFGGVVELVTEMRGARVEQVTGRSLSLGVYLSALALFSGRRVRPGTVASGDLVDGEPRGVGRHEAKLASLLGRSDIERVVVAAEDEALARKAAADLALEVEVVGVDSLEAAARAALGESILAGRDLAESVAKARRTYGDGWGPRGWALVEQAVTPLLGAVPESRPELRLELHTMLAAARRNAGDSAGALDLLDVAAVSLEGDERWIDKRVLAFYRRQRALSLLDLEHEAEAMSEARASMRAAEEAGLPGDYAVALGTSSLVCLGAGDGASALELAEEALDLLGGRDERAALRAQAYRVLALMKLRRVAEAEEALRAIADATRDAYARRAEAWMRAYVAGSFLEMDEPRRAIEVLGAEVSVEELRRDSDLGPLLRLYAGEAWARLGDDSLALDTFQRAPAETGSRTPFQDRRVALTQLRSARLHAAAGRIDAAERCLEAMTSFAGAATAHMLEEARREIMAGAEGPAARQLASMCMRPWEPLFGRAGA
jgi:tetratricopeptide (TPR) repeat protein